MHRQGAFAEFIAVPARCLLPWLEGVSAETAALTEPLGNAIHVVELVRSLRPSNALILGAGPIGLMCQQALQLLLGIPVLVSDIAEKRLLVAARLGAAGMICPPKDDPVAAARAFSGGMGVDLVVDAAGLAVTKRQSIAAARAGGAAVWIGLADDRLEIDTYGITLDERQIIGSYATSMRDLRAAMALLAERRIDTSWCESAPLYRGSQLFHRMLSGNGLKGILLP